MNDLSTINVLAELERCGIKFEYSTQDEIKVLCPFHPDKSPSCYINIRKREFCCKSADCNKHGDFVSYLARQLQTNRAVVIAELSTRYTIEQAKLIDAQMVQRYHLAIWKALPLLQELYSRGVTDELIRKYRLGENDGRIQIPIANAAGLFVNLRKYLPGAPGAEKMKNARGHGEVRWFPIEQLQYDHILLVGGECKAMVAADQLNPCGVGAVTMTAGESNWPHESLRELAGKSVWICLDIDSAGVKSAKQLAMQVSRVAGWTAEPIRLPLDIDQFPKGDINDFVASGGDLLPLIQQAEEFKPELSHKYNGDSVPELIELAHAINAKRTGKRINVKAIVSAMAQSPYVVPKDLIIHCTKDQKECAICPVCISEKGEFSIPCESPTILGLVATPKETQLAKVKEAIGIPNSCRVCDFEASTYYNVEEARISTVLEITNRNREKTMQPAFCIGEGLRLNESYNFIGRMHPHPRNQESTLLISGYETTEDALSTYVCNDPEQLEIFWPAEISAESIAAKLDSIYQDFEANVTHIFKRRDIHLMADLAYHSVLEVSFDGKNHKGWVEVLIMGDSSLGKSETVCGATGYGGLLAHYGLGEKVSVKNSTPAGILGGLVDYGGRWFIEWGKIVDNDRGLLIMEELKGRGQEILSQLTDTRSSGIAEMAKIKKQKAFARTRLIIISNPESDMRLCQYNFGIESIKELVGGLEDIRRFDAALLVSDTDIPAEEINILQTLRPVVPHIYTGDLCRKLILWAWTRKRDEVVFSQEATSVIMESATELSEMFTSAIPLVDRGSMRLKLARLSAAVAARMFSCSNDYQSLIVHWPHVQYIVDFLKRVYSSNVFGYKDYTTAINLSQQLINPEEISQRISCVPYPADFIKQLISKVSIELQDIQDWCGWERQEAQDILSLLVRKHAMVREARGYRKTSQFITLLKQLLDKGGFRDRPIHLNKEY